MPISPHSISRTAQPSASASIHPLEKQLLGRWQAYLRANPDEAQSLVTAVHAGCLDSVFTAMWKRAQGTEAPEATAVWDGAIARYNARFE